ncbi:hypothetical protein NPS74_05870, partial [Cutibacterium acnes subsp. acnes]|nr:hypothetical protein [Cutibacterium acnes subsp. acnes]
VVAPDPLEDGFSPQWPSQTPSFQATKGAPDPSRPAGKTLSRQDTSGADSSSQPGRRRDGNHAGSTCRRPRHPRRGDGDLGWRFRV